MIRFGFVHTVISMSNAILEKIYRFPVKGFPGQLLETTSMIEGSGIPHDRRYAITNGVNYEGEWLRARSFFINAVVDGMSKHKMQFDDETITLSNTQGMDVTFKLDDAESIERANEAIIEFIKPVGLTADAPPPQIIERNQPIANWDYPDTPISIINANSVRAIGEAHGEELDPLRFRGNLIIEDLPAWEEFSWMGKRIKIAGAEIEVHRPIDRCPTPGVNPETGERDINVTQGIQDHFGHIYCGMYAKVVKTGNIKSGNEISVAGDAAMNWQEGCGPEFVRAYPIWPRMAEITAYHVGDNTTQMTLKSATPWPLPEAKVGQRLRLHLGQDQIAVEYISDISSKYYHLDVTDSQTEDPVTAYLRNGLKRGEQIIISGPFGRV